MSELVTAHLICAGVGVACFALGLASVWGVILLVDRYEQRRNG